MSGATATTALVVFARNATTGEMLTACTESDAVRCVELLDWPQMGPGWRITLAEPEVSWLLLVRRYGLQLANELFPDTEAQP